MHSPPLDICFFVDCAIYRVSRNTTINRAQEIDQFMTVQNLKIVFNKSRIFLELPCPI